MFLKCGYRNAEKQILRIELLRDASRCNHRDFGFKQTLTLVNTSNFPVALCQSCCVPNLDTPYPLLLRKFDRLIAFRAWTTGGDPLSFKQDLSTHSTTIELLSPFKLIE